MMMMTMMLLLLFDPVTPPVAPRSSRVIYPLPSIGILPNRGRRYLAGEAGLRDGFVARMKVRWGCYG